MNENKKRGGFRPEAIGKVGAKTKAPGIKREPFNCRLLPTTKSIIKEIAKSERISEGEVIDLYMINGRLLRSDK